MLFNSFQFLLFFAVSWSLFLVLRGTPRKIFLLIASYYFYMCWNTKYIVVIWGITLIDFAAGLLIEKSRIGTTRRFFLGLSLFCNIGLLVVFKYLNFFNTSLTEIVHFFGGQQDLPIFRILLPVGLSFHTFQAMSYTIDVYKKKAPAEKNILDYALYVAFFPQMVAGPIERPRQLLPQFHHEPVLRSDRIKSGITLATWGLFKKMVIADSLSGFVNLVYASPRSYSGVELLLATLSFAIQIYCDFSGYSDIALGIARMMGYELRLNFAQPYFSRSIGEFWHRWHISLSTWFRDYLYIPLGGNRVRTFRLYFNLLATFLLSGLWHGANWTFVVWGGLHGMFLICSHLTAEFRGKVRTALRLDRYPKALESLQLLFTFILVTIAWVPFRASDIRSAWYILTHFYPFGGMSSMVLAAAGIPRANTPFLLGFVTVMFLVEWWIQHPHKAPNLWQSFSFRICCYYGCLYSIIFFGVFGHTDFIYFQF
ncbi:MBOAT family O-acyltransferase [Edaphobacter modestus]|uniref:D-alanyl-lipoteichoic acid acyltransferase DltB (MBOAT superfamily) n=1 Tax=Edaphobacter modestus TaxID=388466 RepID=A0A4Q7YUP7_9BACT|nr:MBOAT family O-acyltransferase [Edaphobacter modestus]RZU41350.1 D-alanyl-lipoteichoic acid acyltransferase DltB (MBOAT superfamily) [Edaphobacter modestus]